MPSLSLPQVTIAVNASAPELHANKFLDNVRTTIDEACLATSCLELELTESVLMRDVDVSDSVLRGIAGLVGRLATIFIKWCPTGRS